MEKKTEKLRNNLTKIAILLLVLDNDLFSLARFYANSFGFRIMKGHRIRTGKILASFQVYK